MSDSLASEAEADRQKTTHPGRFAPFSDDVLR